MFHMEAFRSSLSSGVTDVLQQVTFITANAQLNPSASGAQVANQLPYLHSFFGVSAHLENISPQAPSWQVLPFPNYAPNNIGTAAESPARFWDLARSPKPLRPTETFNIFASQTNGGAENVAVFVNFTDGINNPPPPIAKSPTIDGVQQLFTLHGVGTTTLTANAWSQVTITPDSPGLPAGYYAIVGARAMSAGALAFRIHPVGGQQWRPGGVACQTADQLEAPGQRFINPLSGTVSHWGVWLNFYQVNFPYIDFWSTSADTKQDVWLDLIKISDQFPTGAT